MDLSAVIFAAVAVAWAVYLVPKAIRHHDEADRSRSVERFSESVRVLARRDAVSARDARLVVPESTGGASAATEVDAGSIPEQRPAARRRPTAGERQARRLAARRATRRRRRVLGVLLAVNAVVGGLAVAGVVGAAWVAAPAAPLAAWLVACRLMVRSEHAAWVEMTEPGTHDEVADDVAPAPVPAGRAAGDADTDEATRAPGDLSGDDTTGDATDDKADRAAEAPALAAARTTAHAPVPDGRRLWDPVPMTLPTYVNKATAVRRSVRTIDLDATGVWTSGRTDEDARIAQASARRVAREAGEADDETGRAVGS